MSHEGIRFVSPQQAQAADRADTPALSRRRHSAESPRQKIRRHRRRDRLARRPPQLLDLPLAARRLPLRHLPRRARADRPRARRAEAQSRRRSSRCTKSRRARVEVTPVGKYALKFKWNDGHEAGLYSWDYLRRVCQCAVCKSHAA